MIKTIELEDYLDEYIIDKKENKNLTEETVEKKIYNILKFIEWLKNEKVEEIDKKNIKRILKKYRSYCLNKRNNKRTTTKTYLLSVIDFLNYEEIQIQTDHKTIYIKDIIDVKQENPETARKRIEKISLTKKQSDFFLDTIKRNGSVRDYAICKTFIDSGMRLRELMLLNKTDIKAPLSEKGLYILPSDPNEIIEVHLRAEITKGQYRDRTTFITCDTLIAINQMIMRRMIEFNRKKRQRDIIKMRKNKVTKEKNRQELFTTLSGERFKRRGIQSVIKKYTKMCDQRIIDEDIDCSINYYKEVSVHILRHTALSYYAEILTVAEVQSIAGHANSSTTDKYIHIDNSKIKEKIKQSMEVI